MTRIETEALNDLVEHTSDCEPLDDRDTCSVCREAIAAVTSHGKPWCWPCYEAPLIEHAPTLAIEVRELRARVQDLGTEGHAYREGKLAGHQQAATDRDLVIDHLNDLVAHYAAQAEHWRQVALDGLTRANGHKRDLAAARAVIERQKDHIAGRNYEC